MLRGASSAGRGDTSRPGAANFAGAPEGIVCRVTPNAETAGVGCSPAHGPAFTSSLDTYRPWSPAGASAFAGFPGAASLLFGAGGSVHAAASRGAVATRTAAVGRMAPTSRPQHTGGGEVAVCLAVDCTPYGHQHVPALREGAASEARGGRGCGGGFVRGARLQGRLEGARARARGAGRAAEEGTARYRAAAGGQVVDHRRRQHEVPRRWDARARSRVAARCYRLQRVPGGHGRLPRTLPLRSRALAAAGARRADRIPRRRRAPEGRAVPRRRRRRREDLRARRRSVMQDALQVRVLVALGSRVRRAL
jgi:hypothetical protein